MQQGDGKNTTFDLLLRCTAPEGQFAGDLNALREALRGADWSEFRKNAQYHRLVPLVFHRLGCLGLDVVPENVASELKRHVIPSVAFSLRIIAELLAFSAVCIANGMEVFPFKGPVISQLAYGNSGRRSFTDLDLLAKKNDIPGLLVVAKNQGYQVLPLLSDRRMAKYLRHEDHVELINTKKKIAIDLHWDAVASYSLAPLYFEDVDEEALELEIEGTKIRTMSLEDTIVHHCIHSSSHCWNSLEQVACLVWLVSRNEVCWEKVRERKKLLKSRRIVLLGLYLCQVLYHVELAADESQGIAEDARLRRLGDAIIQHLRECSADNISKRFSWRFSIYHFLIRDNLANVVFYALRMLFSPTVKEWQQLPLPPSLSFLYYGYRPLRLVCDGAMQVCKGLKGR